MTVGVTSSVSANAKRVELDRKRGAIAVSNYLKQTANKGTPDINVRRDASGAPIFNPYNERTDLKSEAIKFYRHEKHDDIENPHFYVYSDIHAGVSESELERVERGLAMAEKDPYARVMLLGDEIDFSVPDSIGDSFGQDKSPRESLEVIQKLFAKLDEQGKIVANMAGNHDHDRAARYMGTSLAPEYIKSKALFAPGMAIHQFVLKSKIDSNKTVVFNVLAQHGHLAKSGPLGTVDSGFKAAEMFGVTVHAVFLGHTHQNAFGTEVYFVKEMGTTYIHKNILASFAIPAAITTQDYALKNGYKLSNTDNNVIVAEQKIDKNNRSRVYFRTYPYSLDALYSAENLIKDDDLSMLKELSKGMQINYGVFKQRITKQLSKMKKDETERKINEGYRDIRKIYHTQILNLTRLENKIEKDMITFATTYEKLEAIGLTTAKRVDTLGIQKSAVNRFNTINSKMSERLTNIHLYVLSDVYINSDFRARINLSKLKEDIDTVAKDPKGLCVINGNIFEFDEGIFGFKRGEPTKTAFEKFDEIFNIVAKEVSTLKAITDDKDRYHKFAEMSDAEKLADYKKFINSDGYKKSAFKDEYDNAVKVAMQKTAYQRYIKLLAKELMPIKDKIVIMNEGSEETKIENFRDYNPMQQLAEEMKLTNAATDSRFWLVNIKLNNFLTDGNESIASILGAYGAKSANTPGALQTRMNNIFKQFPSADINILSGYLRNAIIKENVFYVDNDGTLYIKPRVLVSLSGYKKVLQPNKVHLQSYDMERDMNRYYVDIAIYRDPSYVNSEYINNKGKVIEYNEAFFKGLHPVDVPKDLEQVYIKKAIKIPYKVDANLVPFRCRATVMEDVLSNDKNSTAIKFENALKLVRNLKEQTTEFYEKNIAEILPQFDIDTKNPMDKIYIKAKRATRKKGLAV